MKNLLSLAMLAAIGYWYWSGPFQDQKQPSFEQKMELYDKHMASCLRGSAYASGAGHNIKGSPEKRCAKKYNLYLDQGKWYSYDDVRPD